MQSNYGESPDRIKPKPGNRKAERTAEKQNLKRKGKPYNIKQGLDQTYASSEYIPEQMDRTFLCHAQSATLPATPLSSGTPAADGYLAQNARRIQEFDAYTGSNEI
ncbi:MAG: hypothetical protein WCF17_12620 [Terracidiphilus sp.]